MTIIVAYKESDGTVHLASDSRMSDRTFLNVGTPKIFQKGQYLFGFCGEIWPKQAIACALQIPEGTPPTDPQECIQWVMDKFFFQIRKIILSYITGIKNPPKEAYTMELFFHENFRDSAFIIAWPGFAGCVELDMTIEVADSNWVFTGCGSEIAMGAAHIIDTVNPLMAPKDKVVACVEAAKAYDTACGGPVSYLFTTPLRKPAQRKRVPKS